MPMQLKYINEFEKLFKNNYSPLYFYVLNIIKDKEDAKDIVSNIFEYVWNNNEILKTPESIPSLLYTVAKTRCIDYIRHQNAINRHYEYILFENGTERDQNDTEREEQLDKIITTIENLPNQTKLVVRKCFLEGKKYKEVAEEMGISVNTVKTHVMKAFRILRDEFGIKK